ncbi:MAG: sigma-70 family RNA polymerase sigma factor [Pseudomonadota bacterium]
MKDARAIIREHGPMIARIASSYEASRAEQDELVQDIFLAVWRAASAYRGDAPMRAYIARIAHNVAVSHVRRSVRRKAAPLDDDHIDETANPEADADRALKRRRLLAAIRTLDLPQRQAITLHLEGFGNTEIADVLGLSPNAVAARLKRARTTLADMMKARP